MATGTPLDDLIGEAEEELTPDIGGDPMKTLGRPPMFRTSALLQARIDEYFVKIGPKQRIDYWGDPEWTGLPLLDDEGKPTVDKHGRNYYMPETKRPIMEPGTPPTVAGLALHLGFADYRSIYQNAYKNNPQYNTTIRQGIARVSEYVQTMLISGAPASGPIFWLKNHGWADTIKTELTGKDGGAIETADTSAKDRKALEHFMKQHKDKAK